MKNINKLAAMSIFYGLFLIFNSTMIVSAEHHQPPVDIPFEVFVDSPVAMMNKRQVIEKSE